MSDTNLCKNEKSAKKEHKQNKYNKENEGIETRIVEGIFSQMDTLISEWFKSKYECFTPPQKFAIWEAMNNRNVLVSSPTGSGKTLAAFLTAINMLVKLARKNELKDIVYVVYVSPLKALNNDIKRNLEEPLQEIYALAENKGIKLQKIRVGVRTGDTEQKERQRQLRKPPHILITTPETLSIVLSSPKFSEKLRNVKYLIVDEVHALAENKRGTHLTLSMERLERIQSEKMVRIGLSATIAPLDEVAAFLVGIENVSKINKNNIDVENNNIHKVKNFNCNDYASLRNVKSNAESNIKVREIKVRQCSVVDVTFVKPLDIKVISPINDFFNTSPEEISEKLYDLIANLVKNSKTALIFTNTRSATERVVYNLKKRLNQKIKAHHSSLSRDVRLEVEEELKKGKLKCVVSSTSLELGIDIGYIDLVILIGSPKSINRALQRIGRSGHRLHEVSVGRIVVVDQDDLVECTVLAKEAMERRLDRIRIPQKPLDVLCQHVVGMAIEKKWKVDEALSIVKSAYPYRNLSKKEFISVLKYLSGKYTILEEKNVYGKIWFDEELEEFGKKGKLIRPIYYMNVGTIPDEVAVKVITRDGKVVGKVEEEFAERLVKGDIFVLAGKTFRFLKSKGLKLIVEEVEDEKPTVPSWFSEQLPLSYDLAERVQKFRGYMEKLLESHEDKNSYESRERKEKIVKKIADEFNINYQAARAIVNYFQEQKSFSLIPTDKRIVVEIFKEGNTYVVFHTLIGRRANNALARVFAYRAGKITGKNVGIAVNDNGFMLVLGSLSLSYNRLNEKIYSLFDYRNFKVDLKKALERTEILKRRFRHVAVRSFMILRKYMGREKSVWRQQLSSEVLLNLIKRELPEFPVLKETYREIMEDAMDIDNAISFLKSIGSKRHVEVMHLPSPSPFALNIYVMGSEDAVLMEDKRKILRELHEKILKLNNLKTIES